MVIFVLSGGLCIGLKPLFLYFRGGAVRFSFFWCFFDFMYYSWFFVGLFPFGNKFLIIQKKNALCYVVAAIYCIIVSFVTNEFA